MSTATLGFAAPGAGSLAVTAVAGASATAEGGGASVRPRRRRKGRVKAVILVAWSRGPVRESLRPIVACRRSAAPAGGASVSQPDRRRRWPDRRADGRPQLRGEGLQ